MVDSTIFLRSLVPILRCLPGSTPEETCLLIYFVITVFVVVVVVIIFVIYISLHILPSCSSSIYVPSSPSPRSSVIIVIVIIIIMLIIFVIVITVVTIAIFINSTILSAFSTVSSNIQSHLSRFSVTEFCTLLNRTMFFCFQKGLEVAKVQAEDKDLNAFSYEFYPGLSCFVNIPFSFMFFGQLFLSKICLM